MASSLMQPLAIIANAASSAVAAFGKSSNAITATMATRIPTATGARWRAGKRSAYSAGPVTPDQQRVAKVQWLLRQVRWQRRTAMAHGQHGDTVARAEIEFAQGLADQLRLRRQHDFGDPDGLQRVVVLTLLQSG